MDSTFQQDNQDAHHANIRCDPHPDSDEKTPQQAWGDGGWEPDRLVLDDQALIVDLTDKGLLVITGCGHAGVVNNCRYAHRLTKDRPLYAVMAGFHPNGPLFEPLIPIVLDDLSALTRVSYTR